MSKENEETLEVYQKTANIYIENCINHSKIDPVKAEKKQKKLEKLIKNSFSELPKQSKIFEIGCGDGTNSKFIESLGYNVTASDIADGFIQATEEKGINTIRFNALKDKFPEKYDGIFCWRVFVHFTKEDALKVIEKAYEALEDNGIFIFNAINHESKKVDNEWVDFEGEYHMGEERYYNYFYKEELDNIIKKTNFKIKYFYKDGGENGNKWLIYVLKKENIICQII